VEVLDFTTYFWLYSFFIQNDECATVYESVKVFADLHSSLSHFAGKRFADDSRAKSPLPSHKKAPVRDSTTPLELLSFDFTRSGRLPVRKNSTSTSQRLKQFELYRSWIFLRVQQKLLSI